MYKFNYPNVWKHRLKKDLNNYNPLKSIKNMSVLSPFSFKMDEKLKLTALLQKTIRFHIPASNTGFNLTQEIIIAQNLHPESKFRRATSHLSSLGEGYSLLHTYKLHSQQWMLGLHSCTNCSLETRPKPRKLHQYSSKFWNTPPKLCAFCECTSASLWASAN